MNRKRITKFELAVARTFNQTIHSGKPHDLQALLEFLDKYGAIPEPDLLAEQKEAADTVIDKIITIWARAHDTDPADVAEVERL